MGSVGSEGGVEEGEETYTVAPPSSSEESLSSLSDLTHSVSEKRSMVTRPSAETRGSGVGGPTEEKEEGERGVALSGEGKSPSSNRKQWSKADEVGVRM